MIKETSITEDLLDFTELRKAFISKLSNFGDRTVTALVGDYGSGKSVMLNQIKEESDKNSVWIEFSAWKYPNRENLWESFVIDNYITQIGLNKINKIISNIEGNSTLKNLFKLFSFKLPDFSSFFEKTSIKRDIEFKLLLADFLYRIDQENIFWVIEDIDRSGDNGVYFLETLKFFINSFEDPIYEDMGNQLAEKKIKIIVPVNPQFIEEKGSQDNAILSKVKLEYEKIIDYVVEFDSSGLNYLNFFKKLLSNSKLQKSKVEKYAEVVNDFLTDFINEHKDVHFTPRAIKKITRDADSRFAAAENKQEGHDFFVFLGLSFYLYVSEIKKKPLISKMHNYEGIICPLIKSNKESLYKFIHSLFDQDNSYTYISMREEILFLTDARLTLSRINKEATVYYAINSSYISEYPKKIIQ